MVPKSSRYQICNGTKVPNCFQIIKDATPGDIEKQIVTKKVKQLVQKK